QRTFGWHYDAGDNAKTDKPLQERAVSQAGGEGAKVLVEQRAGDIATQGAAAVQLMVLLGFGADPVGLIHPDLEVRLDELAFQCAALELLNDAKQLLAQEAIIDIAFDGRQDRRQGRLERNDFAIHVS